MKSLSTWIALVCLLLVGNHALAQSSLPYNNNNNPEQTSLRDKEAASNNIRNMRKGALLVRLKTRQNTIDAFKKKGYVKLAKQVEEKQKVRNKKMMKAFQKHFDFCKVYFFYSNDSEKILKENWEGIFLNENLEQDASISVNEEFIFTADVGFLKRTHLEEPETKSHSNTGMSDNILVIKDSEFSQLRRPFPYYIKVSDRYMERKVAKLNTRLHRYHQYWYN